MHLKISIDDLSDGKIIQLLDSHLQEMHKYSPTESIHALDPETLKDASLTFWAARNDNELLGCGALKQLPEGCGEIKSMKTHNAYLRMGIGRSILNEILKEAEKRCYSHVSLETGSHDAFKPAISMYTKQGFIECGPFGSYKEDPYSKFFTKALSSS